jgi:hypothetical protein
VTARRIHLFGLVLTVIVLSSADVLTGAGRSAASTEPHSLDHQEFCSGSCVAASALI